LCCLPHTRVVAACAVVLDQDFLLAPIRAPWAVWPVGRPRRLRHHHGTGPLGVSLRMSVALIAQPELTALPHYRTEWDSEIPRPLVAFLFVPMHNETDRLIQQDW
jgi:hypothetical protein